MVESEQVGKLRMLSSTDGYIHKLGTDVYVKSIILLPTDTEDMYEEVSERPAFTKKEYDEKVAALVRERYSESEEFAIQRKAINAAFSPSVSSAEKALDEYSEYNAYVENCKEQARNPELYKVVDYNAPTED